VRVDSWFRLVGPNHAVEILGVRLVGVSAETGTKLLITVGLVVLVVVLARLLRRLVDGLLRDRRDVRLAFWSRQGVRLVAACIVLLGVTSIWFDDPARLATALGLVTAGLAFALQKVVTAVAGYLVILRGKTFNVGDRIRMGGVRGDVVALDFMTTTIMEMGQPPPVQADEPAMWVQSRQYTGRVVSVSNAAIFEEPVYNYSLEFPYLWEEMHVAIPYRADRARAERILREAAERHSIAARELSAEALAELQRRYLMKSADTAPRVYYRLMDSWLELTVRFIARDHGVREVKDAIGRDVLGAFDEAGIELASPTVEVVGLPPLRVGGEAPARHQPAA
jgi:small-conductance mechanosensitive channel